MDKIKRSGIYLDDIGQLILVTQGLGGYTLVTNKKILFRLYLDASAISHVTSVVATITYNLSNTSISKSLIFPAGSLLIENSAPNGPSIGILFKGEVFPYPSSLTRYEIDFYLLGFPFYVPHFKIPELEFLVSGRLRMLIHSGVGTTCWGHKIEPNFSWLIDMYQSLERFATMLPVRDDVSFQLNHPCAGLCFAFGEQLDGRPEICPSGNPPSVPDQSGEFPECLFCPPDEMIERFLKETKEINSSGPDHVDATVVWRPRDITKFPPPGGEPPGGKAFTEKGLVLFVGGQLRGKELTASLMAQEVGHLFGLEPKTSPHIDDPINGSHSKDPGHFDPFAFDFYLLRPYNPYIPPFGFLGDPMNNSGGGWLQGRDMVLYNAYDWEYLRQRFVGLPGASEPTRPSKEMEEQLVANLQKMFADVPKLDLENPESLLSSKPGFEWHWTFLGFQHIRKGRQSRSESRLTPSVEMILSSLRELDIKEVYAAVSENALRMVINPNVYLSVRLCKVKITNYCYDD